MKLNNFFPFTYKFYSYRLLVEEKKMGCVTTMRKLTDISNEKIEKTQ